MTGLRAWRCSDWKIFFVPNSISKSHQERDTSSGSVCTNMNGNAHWRNDSQERLKDLGEIVILSLILETLHDLYPLSMPMEIMKVNTRCTSKSWQLWPLGEWTGIYRWQDSLQAHHSTLTADFQAHWDLLEYPSPYTSISAPTGREVLLTNTPVCNFQQ